jgi:uncharacterized membrane protein
MEIAPVIRLAAVVAAMIALPALAGDCHPSAAVAKIVTQSQVIYQHAEPAGVLFLVGAPYRAAVIASKHEESREAIEEAKLLRKFRAFLQSEQEPARSAVVKSAVIAEKCAKCHSAQNAAAGIVLDGSKSLSAEEKASVMRSILSGEMPKDLTPLTDEERGQVANFLFLTEW